MTVLLIPTQFFILTFVSVCVCLSSKAILRCSSGVCGQFSLCHHMASFWWRSGELKKEGVFLICLQSILFVCLLTGVPRFWFLCSASQWLCCSGVLRCAAVGAGTRLPALQCLQGKQTHSHRALPQCLHQTAQQVHRLENETTCIRLFYAMRLFLGKDFLTNGIPK